MNFSKRDMWVMGHLGAMAYIALEILLIVSGFDFLKQAATIFFVLPFLFVGLLWLKRVIVREAKSDGNSVEGIGNDLDVVTNVLMVLVWVMSLLPFSAFLAVAQPWPISMRHGPDTGFARNGFEGMVGFEAPDSVSGIYYRVDGGWRSTTLWLRFETKDTAVVEWVIEKLELAPASRRTPGVSLSNSPKWLRDVENSESMDVFENPGRGNSFWRLVHDPVRDIVWVFCFGK